MLVTSIKAQSLYGVNNLMGREKNFALSYQASPNRASSTVNLSFGGAPDTIDRLLPTNENILAFVDKIDKNEAESLGKGVQCEFFRFNDVVGVKSPLSTSLNRDYNGYANVQEHYILNRLNNLNPDIAPKPVALVEKNGKNYLAMTIEKGHHPISGNIQNTHLKNLFNYFFDMDINGITHNDLQNNNLLFTDDGKVKILDFGSYSMLDNDARFLHNEDYLNYPNRDPRDFINKFRGEANEIDARTNATPRQKIDRTFYAHQIASDLKNFSDNPYLNIRSNASNFEFRTLYDYLMKPAKPAQKMTFFKNYLQLKGIHYHAKMYDFLKEARMDHALREGESEEMKKAAEAVSGDAINHEKIMQGILMNPDEKVIKTELGKIELKYFMNDWSTADGKTPKMFQFKSAAQKYINMVRNFEASTSDKSQLKSYFSDVIKHMEQFLDFYSDDVTQIPFKEKESILTLFFEDTTEAAVKAKESMTESAKGLKLSPALQKTLAGTGIIALGAAVGAGIYHLQKGREKPKIQPVETSKIAAASRLTLLA